MAITFLTNDDDEVMCVFYFMCFRLKKLTWVTLPFPLQVRFEARHVTDYPWLRFFAYRLFTEISKSPVSKVPPELAKHEAAQHKVSREMKRKRDADDLG